MAGPFKLELNAIIPMRACRCTADEQAQIHRASGVSSDGAWLDPFLALMEGVGAIGAAVMDTYPGWGAVLTSQTVSITRRHPVAAPALVGGRVTGFESSPKGPIFTAAIAAMNMSHEPFVELQTTILVIDPALRPEKSDPAPQRAESRAPGAHKPIGSFAFSPDAVRCFEQQRPPSLHNDPELALATGFPKPIVSGNQVFGLIWNRLISPRYALPVELRFTLKRPIFWDETITFVRRDRDPGGGEILEVRNAGGKTAMVCEISGDGALD